MLIVRMPSKLISIRFLPWLVLAIALGVTYQLWKNVQRVAVFDLQSNFDYRVLDVISRINERLLSYEQVLIGVQALFSVSGNVGRDEFSSYVSALHFDHNFPGIHDVTLALIAPSAQKGKRATVYIEQFPGRNQLAFGYDVFAKPESRAAMQRALNTGQPAVTGKLIMAAGSDGRRKSGFLMFVPIYKQGAAHDTLAERQANGIGWVAGTFRVNDIMFGILGESAADLDIEIYYGEGVADKALMYDTDYSRTESVLKKAWYKTVKHIDVSGNPWTLEISSLPDFESRLDKDKPLLIAGAGSGISILLAMLTWLLVRGRARSLAAAHAISVSEAKLHAILDNSPIGIWLVGLDGRYRFVNRAFSDALGVTEQQFLSNQAADILGAAVSANFATTDRESMRRELPCLSRETLIFADGKPHLLEITKVRLVDNDGKVSGVIGIMIDITESAALQEALQKSRDELEVRVEERTRDLAATAIKLGQEMQARKKLERSILEISEEAQASIGRELHDDLGQLLTGAAYLAGALASRLAKVDQEAFQQAEGIKKIAQDAIKRTRYISHGLIPFNVSSQGLKQGLEQLAHNVSTLSGMACEVRFSGDTEVTDFMISTHLYRITQEVINNAVKHSSASKIVIELAANSNEICLSIADDGVGFQGDLQDTGKGLGMMNMKYRAQIIGATISLDTHEGTGTRITLVLPLS